MTLHRHQYLPDNAKMAGFCWIFNEFGITGQLDKLTAVSDKLIKAKVFEENGWAVYSNSYWPGNDVFSHLVFILKYETMNFMALKKIFQKIQKIEVEKFINQSPSGIYARKIWFLYELLLDKKLGVEDLKNIKWIKLLDEDKYFTIDGPRSSRHKIVNNIIGIKDFYFIIRKSRSLSLLQNENLKEKVAKIIQSTDKRLISRAASFLLLKDTKATYEIEGERAPKDRLERWGKVIMEAGKNSITIEELKRLHGILFKDDRFVKIGIRDQEVFLGDRDYDGRALPEFIGAKKEDLGELIQLWLKLNQRLKNSELDPILHATVIAFSFLYIHPLQDGNGRIHRYLFHHVLAERNFTPKGLIFPVSSVIFDEIIDYEKSLTNFSAPLMDFIQWKSSEELNVEILNETKELYQNFDLTENAEFFYKTVKQTIDKSLPHELEQLKKYDKAKEELVNIVEMPEQMLTLLINIVKGNDFKLSKAKRIKYFDKLKETEILEIEELLKEIFN